MHLYSISSSNAGEKTEKDDTLTVKYSVEKPINKKIIEDHIYYYTNKQYKETYNPKIVTFRHCYTVRMPSFVSYDFWAKCKYQSQHKCRNTPN